MVVVGEAGALAGRRTLPDEAGRETVKPAEQSHLAAARENGVPWQWGPYLSERQWGTVREDYSEAIMPGTTSLTVKLDRCLPLGRGGACGYQRRPPEVVFFRCGWSARIFLLTFDADQFSVVERIFFALSLAHGGRGVPSSAVLTFTDPVKYFTGIRNLQIVGIIQQHGKFRAGSTRIDLHRLWMHRFDEDLPRIMKVTPSGTRALIVFATGADQPAMQVNGIEISRDEIANIALDWEWYFDPHAL